MNKTSEYLHSIATYAGSEKIWSIRRGDDLVWGLDLRISNMYTDYPFEAQGYRWTDTERLYLCGQFSCGTEEEICVQRKIRQYTSPLEAKTWAKREHKALIRGDFAEFRVEWMLWVVWQKAKGSEAFRQALKNVPKEVQLIENSGQETGDTALVWGCRNPTLMEARQTLRQQLEAKYATLSAEEKAPKIGEALNKIATIGQWTGQNAMGKILTLCRDSIIRGEEPEIDVELLRAKKINILGREIDF